MIFVLTGALAAISFYYLFVFQNSPVVKPVQFWVVARAKPTPAAQGSQQPGSSWPSSFKSIVAVASLLILFGILIWPALYTSGRLISHGSSIDKALVEVLIPWIVGATFGYGFARIFSTININNASYIKAAALLLVAFLCTLFLMTDGEYGWIRRLQKFNVAGSSIEFSAVTTAIGGSSYPTSEKSFPSSVGVPTVGADRIENLISYMESWSETIDRDRDYANEAGFKAGLDDELLQREKTFGETDIVPLGKIIKYIHNNRAYNNVDTLIPPNDRNKIRQELAYGASNRYRNKTSASARHKDFQLAIKALWKSACQAAKDIDTYAKNISNKYVDEYEMRHTKCQEKLANDDEPVVPVEPNPSHVIAEKTIRLPYQIILSSYLLAAAGDDDAAIKDIEGWMKSEEPYIRRGRENFGWLLMYRAHYMVAAILNGSSTINARSYLLIDRHRKIIDIGRNILTSRHISDPKSKEPKSWRQFSSGMKIEESPFSLINNSACLQDASEAFKKFFQSYVSAANNMVWFSSQEKFFTQNENIMSEMQENNKFISAVNMYCLENRKNAASRQDIEKSKAALLDTSASADISMAEFEEKDTIAKDLICSAQRKQNEAVKIFDKTRSIFAGHAPEQWKDARNQADDIERLLSYRRRLLYIQGLIKDKTIRC